MNGTRFEKAEELVCALRKFGMEESSCTPAAYEWAFRGQANAAWNLTPSALRAGTKLGFLSNDYVFDSKGDGACARQMNAELAIVSRFAQLCDRVGLPVPGFHQIFRQSGHDIEMCGAFSVGGIGIEEWPNPEMVELLAVAQHHGVPTRLLDFTYSPMVALYFATHELVKNNTIEASELAVWCIDVGKLLTNPVQFSIIEVARATNPFLFAQRGLFILDRQICDSQERRGDYCLARQIRHRCGGSSQNVVFKYTLPSHEAKAALQILEHECVDRIHLMPTHDNVGRYLSDLTR